MSLKSQVTNKSITELSNEEILTNFLDTLRIKSINTAQSHEIILHECLYYISKPVLEIKKTDIINFIDNIINLKKCKRRSTIGQPISLSTKIEYCRRLKNFFDYIELRSDDDNYRNPVPSIRLLKLSKSKRPEKISEKKTKSFTKDELKEILGLAKARNFRDFIILSILISTGMRVSECLTICIENIDLEKRYIETGFFNGAMKSRAAIFFIPNSFIPYLENFKLQLNKNKGWLFAGINNNHLTVQNYRHHIRKKYGFKWQKFHNYRRSIITHRIDNDCPVHISEILSNHVPTSVEFRHYYDKLNKDNIPEIREWYDKWFPYKDLPYF